MYRLPTIAAILFYWIRMKVVQQLTCLTFGRPNGPAYSTGELLNTPLVFVGMCAYVLVRRHGMMSDVVLCLAERSWNLSRRRPISRSEFTARTYCSDRRLSSRVKSRANLAPRSRGTSFVASRRTSAVICKLKITFRCVADVPSNRQVLMIK